jgi:hypothetical protein
MLLAMARANVVRNTKSIYSVVRHRPHDLLQALVLPFVKSPLRGINTCVEPDLAPRTDQNQSSQYLEISTWQTVSNNRFG